MKHGTLFAILFFCFMLPACELEQPLFPTLTPTPTSSSKVTTTLTPIIPSTPTLTSSPTTQPTKSPTATTTYTLTLSAVPTLANIRSAGTDGEWIRYVHTGYGFAFSAPPDWTVSEWGTHFIRISSPIDPNTRLSIGIRWTYEEIRLTRTGVPAGEIIPSGEVPFFGENISRAILVFQGRDKEVLYHNCTEIKVGERVFTLGFGNASYDYDATDLLTADMEVADGIVASFGY